MTKKFVSILSVILIIITIAFPVMATGNVTLTVNVTGTTTITVTQNGSGISPSGNENMLSGCYLEYTRKPSDQISFIWIDIILVRIVLLPDTVQI